MDLNDVRPRLPETIVTARLELRRPAFADVQAITLLANNKKISDMLSTLPHPYTDEDAIWFLNNRARSDTEHPYAITLKRGAFIGMCGLTVKPRAEPEIGYWLGEPYWGSGYASEAAGALVDAIFATRATPVITARALAVNAASCRVLEKLGFRFVCMRIEDYGDHPDQAIRHFEIEAESRRRTP
jgi:RimJ/RimL family protein N-acetyltransferase